MLILFAVVAITVSCAVHADRSPLIGGPAGERLVAPPVWRQPGEGIDQIWKLAAVPTQFDPPSANKLTISRSLVSVPFCEELQLVCGRSNAAMGLTMPPAPDQGGDMEPPKPFALLPDQGLADNTQFRKDISTQCGIREDEIEDVFPCTTAQQSLFAATVSGAAPYMRRDVFRLPANSDVESIKRAWQDVYRRHQCMRLQIITHPELNGLHQAVSCAPVKWVETQAIHIQEFINADALHPIKMGEPLMKYALVHESSTDDDYVVWTTHHAAMDAATLSQILSDVDESLACTQSPVKPEVRPPFSCYVAHFQMKDRSTAEAYWKDSLARAPVSKYPPPGVVTAKGAANAVADSRVESQFALPARGNAVKGFARPVILYAAWALLLTIFEESEDVLFGTTMGCRREFPQAKAILGPMITTVPFRVSLPKDNRRISNYLEIVKKRCFGSGDFEFLGAAGIAALDRALAATAVFNNIFIVEGAPDPKLLHKDGLFSHSPLDQDAWTSTLPLPLTVRCVMQGDEVTVHAHYQSDRLRTDQANLMLSQFQHLVQGLCATADAEATLDQLTVASPADCASLFSWNSGLMCQPPDGSALSLFFRNVEKYPNNIAIESWDGSLTYAQLDQASSRLASHLTRTMPNSLGAEKICAMMFNKSKWMIVSILATLKTGSAYASIDPWVPIGRQHALLRVTGTRQVLCGAEWADADIGEASRLVVDQSLLDSLPPVGEIRPQVPSSQLALILFTSGSTGEPKGIAHSNGSLSSIIGYMHAYHPYSPSTRMLHFAAYSFDMAQAEIHTTLACGGTLCIASEDERLTDLPGAIGRLNANTTMLTPTVLQWLSPDEVPSIKTILTTGESPTRRIIETWTSKIALHALYGPAEMILGTCGQLKPDSHFRAIGRGRRNAIWITEPSDPNRLRPIGAVGEIVVQTTQLARGYLNRPELTARNFLRPDQLPWLPPSKTETPRLYRTGDMGFYLPDGSLRFVGRHDTQVKIRGKRIEMEEIEQHMKTAPGVDKRIAVACDYTVRSTEDETKWLVGFMSYNDDQEMTAERKAIYIDMINRMKDQVTNNMAGDMFPQVILILPRLPSTPTGKLDRKGLRALALDTSVPTIDPFGLSSDKTTAASPVFSTSTINTTKSTARPLSETEHILLETSSKVLKLDLSTVDISNHFFSLGGESIKAMQLVSQLRVKGVQLAMSDVFDHPVFEAMAKMCTRNESAQMVVPAPFELLKPANLKAKLVECAVAQCRVVAKSVLDVYPTTTVQKAVFNDQSRGAVRWVLELSPETDIAVLQKAWTILTMHNAALRTRVVTDAVGGLWQVVLRDRPKLSIVDDANEDDANTTNFQPGEALVRARVVESKNDQPAHVIFTACFALFDESSVVMTLSMLEQAYHGALANSPTPHKLFIRQRMQADEAAMRAFWTGKLRGVESAQQKPHAVHKSENGNMNGTNGAINGTNGVADGACTESRGRWAQAFVSDPTATVDRARICASWAMIMHRLQSPASLGEDDDVVFGAMARPESSANVLGFASVWAPIRMRVQDNMPAGELLQQAETMWIQAMRYGHLDLAQMRSLGDGAKEACSWSSAVVFREEITPSKLWTRISDQGNYATMVSRVQHQGEVRHLLEVIPRLGGLDIRVRSSTLEDSELLVAAFASIYKRLQTNETAPMDVTEAVNGDLNPAGCGK